MESIDKAIEDYNKTIELDNKKQEAYYHRGNLYLEDKKYKKALNDFEKYLELNSNDVEIKYSKRLAEIILGKSDKKEFSNNDNITELSVTEELKYHIKKIKNRIIYSPNEELKQLQKDILSDLKTLYPLKMSIIESAKIHTNSKYLLKIDIKHFFDTIPVSRIDKVLEELSQKSEKYSFDELKMATTVYEHLPTGACTSPHIANAAIKDIDENILKFCQKYSIRYSRYMDDMFFSADNKDYLKLAENFVQDILSKNAMEINQSKTKYVSDNKKQVILGVLVNKENCCLPKETKRKIRAILHNYMCGKIDNENYIVGYLSYVFSVDKPYFKILNKYYTNYKKKYNTPKDKIKLIGRIFNRISRKHK
jgi:tetratricopeptide (TPR) repeat protein